MDRCNRSGGEDSWGAETQDGNDVIVTCISLCSILVISLAANIYLHFRLRKKRDADLLRILLVLGSAHLLTNIPLYVLKLLAGGWVLGRPLCQLSAVISSASIGVWFVLLTLAVVERYYLLQRADEYASSFSHINLRLQVWGCALLVLMQCVAPLHGWGEYSHFRGSANIHLTFNDYLPNSSTTSPRERLAVPYNISSVLANASCYMGEEYNAVIRSAVPRPGRAGAYVLTARLHSKPEALRLETDILCHRLEQEVRAMALRARCEGTGQLWRMAKNITVSIVINEQQFRTYRTAMLDYQDCNTCGFDFSPTNAYVFSFLAYSLTLLLVLPALASAIFYSATIFYSYYRSEETHVATTHSIHVKILHDKTLAHVFALTALLTFCIHVTYFWINLRVANGAFYDRKVYLFNNVLINSEPLLLPFSYALIYIMKTLLAIFNGSYVRTVRVPSEKRQLSGKKTDTGGIEMETYHSIDDRTTKSSN